MKITIETESSGFVIIENAQFLTDSAMRNIYDYVLYIENTQRICNWKTNSDKEKEASNGND